MLILFFSTSIDKKTKIDRMSTSFKAGIAQQVERLTCNEDVTGSIPVSGSIFLAQMAELVDALASGASDPRS